MGRVDVHLSHASLQACVHLVDKVSLSRVISASLAKGPETGLTLVDLSGGLALVLEPLWQRHASLVHLGQPKNFHVFSRYSESLLLPVRVFEILKFKPLPF